MLVFQLQYYTRRVRAHVFLSIEVEVTIHLEPTCFYFSRLLGKIQFPPLVHHPGRVPGSAVHIDQASQRTRSGVRAVAERMDVPTKHPALRSVWMTLAQ